MFFCSTQFFNEVQFFNGISSRKKLCVFAEIQSFFSWKQATKEFLGSFLWNLARTRCVLTPRATSLKEEGPDVRKKYCKHAIDLGVL